MSSATILRARAQAAAPGRLQRLLRAVGGADARRGMLAILDQGVVSAASFVTFALIAMAGGRFELGVALLTLTILLALTNLQSELVNAPFTVYLPRYRGSERASYAGSMFAHQSLLAAGGCFILLMFLIGINASGSLPHLVPPLIALLAVAPFCLLQSFLRHLSFACMRFLPALAMDLVVAFVQIGLLLALLYAGALSVVTAIISMGVAAAVACLAWFAARPEPLRFVPERWLPDWRSNWNFGRWSLSSHALGCATIYILPWLLRAAQDESATGTLAACSKLSALAGTFVIGVAHFLTPKAVSAYATGGLRGLWQVMAVSGAVFATAIGTFCLLVALYGDVLMVALFGDEFAGTGRIAALLSAAVLVNSMSVVAGNALWAIHRPQANLVGDGVTLAVTLLFASWLVGPYGALGIAFSMLAGTTMGAIVRALTFWLSTLEIRREAEDHE